MKYSVFPLRISGQKPKKMFNVRSNFLFIIRKLIPNRKIHNGLVRIRFDSNKRVAIFVRVYMAPLF